jgi:Rrf2 family protein
MIIWRLTGFVNRNQVIFPLIFLLTMLYNRFTKVKSILMDNEICRYSPGTSCRQAQLHGRLSLYGQRFRNHFYSDIRCSLRIEAPHTAERYGIFMLISTKGRYSLRVMIDLAEHQTDDYIPLKEIAARQEISEKYLESIIKLLVKGRFLTGLRGKGGGYRLIRSAADYSVGEILEAVGEQLAPVSCLLPETEPCDRESACPTIAMWKKFNQLSHDFFYGITLADLTAP